MSKKFRLKFWFERKTIGQFLLVCIIFAAVVVVIYGLRQCFEPTNGLLHRTIAEMVSPVEFNRLAHDTLDNVQVPKKSDCSCAVCREKEIQPSDTAPNNKKSWKPFWLLFLIFSLGSVLFTGGVIAILSNWIRSRAERYCAGLTHYPQNGHYLILGYNELSIGLIKHLFEKSAGNDIDIVLQTTQSVPPLRKKVESQLTKEQCRHLFFIYASRDSENGYNGLYVTKAKKVYVLGEEDEVNHDNINLNALMFIAKILQKEQLKKEIKTTKSEDKAQKTGEAKKGEKKRLECHLYLENQSTFYLFQTNEISKVQLEGDKTLADYITVYPFNADVNWARMLFVKGESETHGIDYKPLDFNGIGSNDERYVHLVIVGMTPMGNALALEAAHIAHYPNFRSDHPLRTRITMIDKNAKEEMLYLTSKYDHYFDFSHYRLRCFNVTEYENEDTHCLNHVPERDFLDIEWEFIQADCADPGVQDEIKNWANDKNQLLTIAFCVNDIAKNVAMGYYLPDNCYNNDQVSVLIRQNHTGEVLNSLYKQNIRYGNVRPFGMLDDGFTDDEVLVERARRVNQVYNGKPLLKEDYSGIEELWSELSVAEKWSNMYNAMSIPGKLRSLKCDANIVEKASQWLPAVEHNRWNVEKLLLGFRPTTKNEDEDIVKNKKKGWYKKELQAHYDIRPYEDLRLDDEGKNPQRFDISLSQSLEYIIKVNADYSKEEPIDLLRKIEWTDKCEKDANTLS